MAAQPARKLFDPNAPNDPSVEAAFQAVPDTMVAEIIDGQLHTMPRPGRRHTKASTRLAGEIVPAFYGGKGGPGGWVILFEPELHLGPRPDKLVPDLAGWRSERMPEEKEDENDLAYYDVAPDWVCEVLSPSTEAKDRVKKMHIYRHERVPHVWLIHPTARTLEVYRLQGTHYLLLDTYAEEDVVRAEPFDAIELPLSILWMGGPRPVSEE
jgi:Uma2 family endonuclease